MIIMPYAEQHIGGNGRMSQESIDKLAQLGITIDQDWLIN
jgi:hypothetical protein